VRLDGPSAVRTPWKGFPGESERVESLGIIYQDAFGGSRLGKYVQFCGDSAIASPLAPANRLAYSLSKRTVAQPDVTKRPARMYGGPFLLCLIIAEQWPLPLAIRYSFGGKGGAICKRF
jgi:hypothetical protein